MEIIKVYKKNQITPLLFKKISNVLNNSGLVVIPTDTVYGLAVEARDKKAVKKLIEFKHRPYGMAISVFVSSIVNAKRYVEINKKQEKILKQILPGAYTIILPSKSNLCFLLESEDKTLGIRIPKHFFINKLSKQYIYPITSTSANINTKSPHYSIESLLNSLSEKKKKMIDLIVDFGKLPRNRPSTVIDLTCEKIKVLRQGDVFINTKDLLSKEYISNSETETKNIAVDIFKMVYNKSKENNKPLIFLLQGELGVGKTVFVKAIAESLGINDIISPTFVICQDYEIKNLNYKRLFHFDLYRLINNQELNNIGLNECIKNNNLIFIEWSEKSIRIIGKLKEKTNVIIINIDYLKQNKRRIKVKSNLL